MSKAAELAALIGSQTALSNRNLIINGAMNVAQRGTSASVSNDSNEGYQTLDRWYFQYGNDAGGTVTVSQDSTVPSGEGFANSYKVDVTSADTSLASNHNVYIGQTIESQNMASSGWNYTDPNSFVTLSFYARSSVDTTLCFMARNYDAGYYYVKEFSLTANTWKRVSHAIPGNANLVFNDDNGEGLSIWIILATGSDNDDSSDGAWNSSFELATSNQANFLASTSNILHLTGVQLEVGEQSTPFEHRSFGDELRRCQRYFQRTGEFSYFIVARWHASAGRPLGQYTMPVTMRAAPSVSISTTFTDGQAYAATPVFDSLDPSNFTIGSSTTNASANDVQYAHNGKLDIDAEL